MKQVRLQKSTVMEFKEAVTNSPSGTTFVWGTKILKVSTKEDIEAELSAMNDEDSLVWGT